MIELLDAHQITSLDTAERRRAFNIAVVIDGRLSPILTDLSLFCSQPLAILRLLWLYIDFLFSAMLITVNHAILIHFLLSYRRIKYFNNRLARYIFVPVYLILSHTPSLFTSRYWPESRLHKYIRMWIYWKFYLPGA